MKKILIILILISSTLLAQENKVLKGIILDSDKQTALAYANIVVLHNAQGTISNELGSFSLDISSLESSDTISFQYIGYKTLKLTLKQIDSLVTDEYLQIFLKEEVINLSEAFVFSNPPDAEFIIEQVLEHQEQNYKRETSKNQVFIRQRNTSDIDDINIKLKRNDIPELNQSLIKQVEKNIPKHNTSYTDLLGKIYFSESFDDSIKVNPIKTVSLKEPEVSELDQISKIFEKLFKDTKEKEYWKVKTGIFSQEITINEGEQKDSTKNKTIDKSTIGLKTQYLNNTIKDEWAFSSLENDDEWEFLYKTGKYNFTLSGGTRVNGEDVYIIDFTPKSSGLYIGRAYISINTYALIRADYQYDTGKQGTNIQLFGVGYSQNHFEGSILFEKKDKNYILKYLSRRKSTQFSFDRNLSLIKKRERFLFDKELYEIKVKFNITVTTEESTEILILNHKTIPNSEFNHLKQDKFYQVIYVDQFNDTLWKGYSIIEPTQQMREYKKHTDN